MSAAALGSALALAAAWLLWPRRRATDAAAVLLGRPDARTGVGSRLGSSSARWRRRVRSGDNTVEEITGWLSLLDALAPALAAGLTPVEAWACATQVGGAAPRMRSLGDDVHRRAALGEPVSDALWEHALARPGPAVTLLATAWRLSELSGAPLAATVRTVARMMREDVAARRRVEAALTEARMTVRILTLLPIGGPVLALLIGIDPAAFLGGSAGMWVRGSVLTGVGLVGVGRVWMRRMAAKALASPAL